MNLLLILFLASFALFAIAMGTRIASKKAAKRNGLQSKADAQAKAEDPKTQAQKSGGGEPLEKGGFRAGSQPSGVGKFFRGLGWTVVCLIGIWMLSAWVIIPLWNKSNPDAAIMASAPELKPVEQNRFLTPVQPNVLVFDTVWYSGNQVKSGDKTYAGNWVPPSARLFEIRPLYQTKDGPEPERIALHEYVLSSAHSKKWCRGKLVHVRCLKWSYDLEAYVPVTGGDFDWTLGPNTFPKEKFLEGTRAILVYGNEPVSLGFVFRKP